MKNIVGLLSLLMLSACASTDKVEFKKFTAERLWARATPAKENLGFRRLHRMTPIATDNYIFQGNAFDGMVAYDRNTAREIWRLKIKDGVEAGAALEGGILYFGANDGYFYAVQADNGQIRWSIPIRSEGLGEPLIKDGVIYFMSGANVAYAIEAQTGKQLWLYNRRDTSSLSIRGTSKPSIFGNTVFFGFNDGYVVALNRQSGALEWEQNINQNKRFRDVDSSPVIDGDRIYAASFDGGLYCLNRADGRILWSVNEGGDTSPILTVEHIYYSTSDGLVRALDKNSGKEIWSINLDGKIATKPTLHRGLLVFGEYEGKLKFVDARNGQLVGFFEPGRGVTSTPLIDVKRNEVYFISADANLFAVRMAWKNPAKNWPWEK